MRKALVKRGNKVIEVDIDDNYVNQLQKAQDGKQLPKPVYDEYGAEIISSKHRNRNGKDFQKYRKYDPDSGREYIEKQFFNPNTNKIESSVRDKGSLYRGYSTRDAIAPNPFIDIEQYVNPYRTDFNQQPTMFQMGGAPQQQMAQQQMPPQQEGQASEQDQIMQLIQAYAASMQVSPEEIIQELQQMNPQEQQAAIQQMAQELQGEQEQAPQQEMAPEQMMQRGGTKPIYTPDTGIEQYAPDTSWYDGGDQVAAPGNVVSFPSYPEQGTNALARFIPVENQYNTQQPPPRRGTGITTFNSSSYDQDDRDSSYDEYNPVRRVPFLENLGDRIGDGFDNVGDFFKRLRKNRRRRKGPRGNGLFSCKPGTDCYRHKEGGVTNGQYPIDYYMPESKLKTFIDLAQGYGQENYDNTFMNNLDETIKKKDYFQIGGYITNEDGSQSYDLGSGYDPNKLSRAYAAQNNASNLSKKGDTFGAIANATQTFANNVGTNLNNAYKIAKVAAPIAANVVAPGSGALVKAGINAMDKPKDGATAGGFDPSSLISMFAKRGGSLPKYQIDGQFSSGIGSFGNSPAYNFGNSSNSGVANLVLPAPIQNITMADQSLNTPIDFGPQDDPITTNATNPNKDKELINGPTQRKKKEFTNPLLGIGPAIAGIFEAAGNAKKARRAQNQADRALLSDNLFASTDINRGDYVTNTQPNTGNFRPDDNVVMGLNASQRTKYGAQIAKDGAQISNPYMSNSNSESTLYGESEREISNTLKPVKRDLANLEAEIGEVAVTPGGADGIPKFFKIGGKNHYDGGTPLSLPENTFIYSKTKSMIIKDPKILKELTGSTKPASPAELAKKFDYSEYIAVLQNKNADPVERKTAEMMIESMMYKLGQIAIIQEAKKGFPSGIPLVAVPYLEKAGIDPQMLLPQTEEEPQEGDPGMEQQMDPAMQEQMMQQPQEQMDPRMIQEQMEPIPPMQKGGNKSISRPTPIRSNVQQGSNSVLSSGYDRDLNYTQFGSRIINEYGNGLPNDTSYIYQSPNEDYFYNTGQNTQDSRPVSNYNSGSNAPLDAAAYQSMIRKLAGYAYGGTTWVPPDEELLSMGYSPSHIEAIKLADKKSPVFDSEAAYNNIAYNASVANSRKDYANEARFKAQSKNRLDQALRDGMPLQSLQFSENRPILSNDKRRNRIEDFDRNRERNQQGTPTENINDYESRMKREATFRYGGSNLERYQTKGQVSNSALLNRISKDIKTYPREINTDSANKYLPWNNSDTIENYPLIYNTDSLRKYLPWNNEVPEDSSIFDNYEPNKTMTPYQMGGTNIMGSPVLPRYQTKGQVDRNPAQQVVSLLAGRGSIQKPNDEATGYWDRVAKNWSNVEFTSDWNDPRSDPRVKQAAKELIPFNGSDGVLDYFGNMFTVPQKTANMLLTGLYESPMTTLSRTSEMSEGEKLLGDIVTDPMIIPEIPYAIGKGLYRGASAGLKAAVPFARKAALSTALAGKRIAEITTELAAKYGPKLIELASKYIGKIPPERMVLVASRVSQAATQANNNRTPVDLDVLFQQEIDKELKLNKPASTDKTSVKSKASVTAPIPVRPVQQPVKPVTAKPTTTKSKSTSTQTTIPTTSSNLGLMKLNEGEYYIVK